MKRLTREKMKKENNKNEIGIEELLHNLRMEKNYTYLELAEKINDRNITEKTVKKWEKGLEYPNLNIIYQLSEIYNIPSQEILEARDNSFKKGLGRINFVLVKWICYFLDITIKTSMVMIYAFIVFMLYLSFGTFIYLCYRVKR